MNHLMQSPAQLYDQKNFATSNRTDGKITQINERLNYHMSKKGKPNVYDDLK